MTRRRRLQLMRTMADKRKRWTTKQTIEALGCDLSIHVATLPLARIASAIGKLIRALAMHLILAELALKHFVTKTVLVTSSSMLHSMQKPTLVARTIRPSFSALARLLIVFPGSFVNAAILMDVLALPMCSVFIPLASRHKSNSVTPTGCFLKLVLVDLEN